MHFKIHVPCLVTAHNTTDTPADKHGAFPINVTTSEPIQKVFHRNGVVEMYWPFATAKSEIALCQVRAETIEMDQEVYMDFSVKHMV